MLRLLLVLYGFAIPYETFWSGTGGGQTIFKPYRIIGLAAFGLWCIALLRRGRRPRLDFYDGIFLTIFGLGLALATFWSVFAGQGSLYYAVNATALGLFAWSVVLAIKSEARSGKDLEILWLGFVAGNLTALLAAFVLKDPYDSGRLVGFYDNPNSLAFSLGAAAHYLVARLLRRPRSLSSFPVLLCVVGLSVAVLLTGSRAGILAYGGSLLVSFFLAPRRRGRIGVQLAMAAAIVGLIGFAGYRTWESEREDKSALQRLEWENTEAGSGRRDIWRAGWNVAEDHFFIGAGTAQYHFYHSAYISQLDKLYSPSVGEKAGLGVHSEYLDLLISSGIIGLVLYLFLVLHAGKKSRRAAASEAGALPGVHAALPVLLLLAVVQITAILFGSPLFFFLIGLVAIAGRLVPARIPGNKPALRTLRPEVSPRSRRPGPSRLSTL